MVDDAVLLCTLIIWMIPILQEHKINTNRQLLVDVEEENGQGDGNKRKWNKAGRKEHPCSCRLLSLREGPVACSLSAAL